MRNPAIVFWAYWAWACVCYLTRPRFHVRIRRVIRGVHLQRMLDDPNTLRIKDIEIEEQVEIIDGDE